MNSFVKIVLILAAFCITINCEVFIPEKFENASSSVIGLEGVLNEESGQENDFKSDYVGPFVIGGTPAKPGDIPHYVLIYTEVKPGETLICGGSLIKNNWVLTAGHCIYDDFHDMELFFGIVNIHKSAAYSTKIKHSDIIRHHKYKKSPLQNDIALIHLRNVPKDLMTLENVGTIDLPNKEDTRDLTGWNGFISGFGRYSDSSEKTSDRLVYNSVTIISNEDCAKRYGPGYIIDTNICARATTTASTCRGDSGGPYFLMDGKNSILIGIVSFGREVCEKKFPVVFTRVSKYLEWIETTIEKAEN